MKLADFPCFRREAELCWVLLTSLYPAPQPPVLWVGAAARLSGQNRALLSGGGGGGWLHFRGGPQHGSSVPAASLQSLEGPIFLAGCLPAGHEDKPCLWATYPLVFFLALLLRFLN